MLAICEFYFYVSGFLYRKWPIVMNILHLTKDALHSPRKW